MMWWQYIFMALIDSCDVKMVQLMWKAIEDNICTVVSECVRVWVFSYYIICRYISAYRVYAKYEKVGLWLNIYKSYERYQSLDDQLHVPVKSNTDFVHMEIIDVIWKNEILTGYYLLDNGYNAGQMVIWPCKFDCHVIISDGGPMLSPTNEAIWCGNRRNAGIRLNFPEQIIVIQYKYSNLVCFSWKENFKTIYNESSRNKTNHVVFVYVLLV